jgi:ornithine cyclodeaminase
VLLFDTSNGALLAILDATSITAIRTAAVSGVATRLLARARGAHAGAPRLRRAGAVASGGDARGAPRDAGPRLEPDRERVTAFVRGATARFDCEIEAAESARAAVEAADVVCTVTSAREPVLEGAWLAPGTHINAVGSSIRSARELDTDAVVRSRLFVDRRESATAEAGDFIIPKQEGAIDDDHIVGELGELLLDRIPGRRSPSEITLFKSLGLAVEDLAAASHIYRRALETGAGHAFDLGGTRLEW